MSEAIRITKISRPSREGAVSPSSTRASFSGGFFNMRSETSNTNSSSRVIEQLKKDLLPILVSSLIGGIIGLLIIAHLEAYLGSAVESTIVLPSHSDCLPPADLLTNPSNLL